MLDKTFWDAALTRAGKTMAQTATATIGAASVMSDVNWGFVLSASILAGVLSILTSIYTGLPEVEAYKATEEALIEDMNVDEPDDSFAFDSDDDDEDGEDIV